MMAKQLKSPPPGLYNYMKVLYVLCKYIDKTPATGKELWDSPEIRNDLVRLGIKSFRDLRIYLSKMSGNYVYAWKEDRMMGYRYMINLTGLNMLHYRKMLNDEGLEYYRDKVLSILKRVDAKRYNEVLKRIREGKKRFKAKLNKS